MATDQQFCLRWNNHQSTLISVFDSLLENGTLVDCTLAAEGQYLKAHKVVLSACSPYLETLLSQHYEKHPIVILKDVKFSELKSMMDYMYRGEVNISQDQLGTFLKAAESLQIKGLSDNGDDARDVGSTAKKPDAPRPSVTQTRAPVESKRPAPVGDMSDTSRDGSISPSSLRKRRRTRRPSQGDDPDSNLDNNVCDLPAAQSTPMPVPSAAPVQSLPKQIVKTEPPPPMPEPVKKEILDPPAEPLLEPKTEYLDYMNNENSIEVEDLTLDDDDEEGLDSSMDASRPGPSHGDLSQQGGYPPWTMAGDQSGTDEIFMAAQEAVGAATGQQQRDSQGIDSVCGMIISSVTSLQGKPEALDLMPTLLPEDTESLDSLNLFGESEDSIPESEDPNLGLEGSIPEPEDANLGQEDSIPEPEDANLRQEDSIAEPGDVNLGQEDSIPEPEDANLGQEDSIAEPGDVNLGQEDSIAEPEGSNLEQEDSIPESEDGIFGQEANEFESVYVSSPLEQFENEGTRESPVCRGKVSSKTEQPESISIDNICQGNYSADGPPLKLVNVDKIIKGGKKSGRPKFFKPYSSNNECVNKWKNVFRSKNNRCFKKGETVKKKKRGRPPGSARSTVKNVFSSDLAKPHENKLEENKPNESKPGESNPAESKPVEHKPVEAIISSIPKRKPGRPFKTRVLPENEVNRKVEGDKDKRPMRMRTKPEILVLPDPRPPSARHKRFNGKRRGRGNVIVKDSNKKPKNESLTSVNLEEKSNNNPNKKLKDESNTSCNLKDKINIQVELNTQADGGSLANETSNSDFYSLITDPEKKKTVIIIRKYKKKRSDDVPVGKGVFKCDDCGRTYCYLRGLRQHKRLECNVPPQFPCPFCPRAYRYRQLIRDHVRDAHPLAYPKWYNLHFTQSHARQSTDNTSILT